MMKYAKSVLFFKKVCKIIGNAEHIYLHPALLAARFAAAPAI